MLDFKSLWMMHPANNGVRAPCSTDGKVNFSNQCAIRMGVCLSNADVSLDGFKGARCYPGHNHGRSHILRAEELANWMADTPATFGTVQKHDASPATAYTDRTGIVFFLNFWGTGNQGDHIDLWNGNRLTPGSSATYFESAEKVWFWDVA